MNEALAEARSSFDLSFFKELPPPLRWSCVIYILHILLVQKIALAEQMAFWSIFFLGFAMYRKLIGLTWHILYYPLVLYGVVSTISAMTAPRRIHPWGEGMLWFKMLIFPAALMLLRKLPRFRVWALGGFYILGFGSAVWGLIEYFFLHQRDLEHRINGPASHVMTFSGMLLPLSLVMLVLWWHGRKWWQGVACCVTTFALLLTFTRSVWLGWGVAVFALLIAMRPRALVWATAALLFFISFAPLALFSRMISVFDVRQESNLDRIRMVEAGIEIIRDYPLLGVGPANVKEVYPLYRKPDAPRFRPPHLHNNIVQLWAERGILGLSAYIILIALFLRECAKAWRGPNRKWAEVGVAVTVSLTYAGLFEFNFGDTEVFYLMLNLYAFLIVQMEQPPRLIAANG